MTTKLDKAIKREVAIGDDLYTVTMEPAGVRIVAKGKRLGHAVTWEDLLTGQAELSSQLRRSLAEDDESSLENRHA
jgi:hypothetical protein